MNKKEFQNLSTLYEDPWRITGLDLLGGDRTLLYGFTFDRSSYHLYIEDNLFTALIYDNGGRIIRCEFTDVLTEVIFCQAVKMLHPECCDFVFCASCVTKGIELTPFTIFTDRDSKKFYGYTEDELS